MKHKDTYDTSPNLNMSPDWYQKLYKTHWLTYFLMLAETQNISKAAKMLCITQQAMSQFLFRIEERMGTALFDRQDWTLTETGQKFYARSKNVSHKLHTLENSLCSTSAISVDV